MEPELIKSGYFTFFLLNSLLLQYRTYIVTFIFFSSFQIVIFIFLLYFVLYHNNNKYFLTKFRNNLKWLQNLFKKTLPTYLGCGAKAGTANYGSARSGSTTCSEP